MRLPLQALGYEIIGKFPVFSFFDKVKVKENSEILSHAARLGSELAESLLRPAYTNPLKTVERQRSQPMLDTAQA